ncbi:PAS domain S-box protein [Sphingobacterium corticibacter]|uniref:histidine kinase n=1 Tax=Sphingobacterium corticibacter TaxID=2171749 RepID=A0A2T8HFR3_9SPHI|nr:PAS domain S-box protein [Sphingobacterium corticibacter]PVH24276.1 hypothetical protein DC487_14415 [Sphingobacterium corticibacter]
MNLTLRGLLHVIADMPHAVAVYDSEDLNIAVANAKMLAIWSRKDDLTGRQFGEVFPEHVAQGFDALLRNVWKTGHTYDALETRADITIDGIPTTRFFDFQYKALKDENGETYALLHTATDVTDRKLAWENVAQREASEASINEELRDNNEKLNLVLSELEQRDKELQKVNDELASNNLELIALNEEYQSTNEMLHQTHLNLQQANDSLKVAYEKVQESEDRMNLAIQSANIGTWRLDVAASQVHWDNRTRELYGFSSDEVVPYEDVLKHMHPQDRPTVQTAIERALVPELNEEYDIKFRIISNSGELLRWLHCKGKAYFDQDGGPTLFSGIALDITETMVARERESAINLLIAERERKLQLILDAAKVGTYTFNKKTRRIQLNEQSRKLFGFTRKELITEDFPLEQTVAEFIPMATAAMENAIADNRSYDYSYQIVDKRSGAIKWLRSVGNSQSDPSLDVVFGVIIDITDQKAEEKRKTDFLGIASHELRSPLTALTGYLHILGYKGNGMSSENLANTVKKAEQQTNRMKALIDGFLDASIIDEGKMSITRSDINVVEMLSDIYHTYKDTIHSHQFSMDIPTENVIAFADRGKLEQVVTNFLNNAIKYTSKGGLVKLFASVKNDTVMIGVRDQGEGISQENQDKLFDKFFRISDPSSKDVAGFGIGLFVSKEIVLLHGGNIGVESEQGKGSTFWFTLPL